MYASMADTARQRLTRDEKDVDSVVSFDTTVVSARPAAKIAWSPNDKVNHESFHRMLEDYRAAKAEKTEYELKAKQLAAQLARTEEAAKRALMKSDASAKGGVAQKLLDAEREAQRLRELNVELTNKLSREKKRAADFKLAAEGFKGRLEAAMREQRSLVRRVGELQPQRGRAASANRQQRPPVEEEYWSEEAGRRFAQQQEELVTLREENAALKQGQGAPRGDAGRYEEQIRELQQKVRLYERKLATAAQDADSVSTYSADTATTDERPAHRRVGHTKAGGTHGSSPSAAGRSTGGGGHSLQDTYLRERVQQLEAELASYSKRKARSPRAEGHEVASLRREVSRYQQRVQELEQDFLSLDVMANTDLSDYDAEMRKAWHTAGAFKKRYMEHKSELDQIRATYERMQQQLDETHKALQAEHARSFKLESDNGRLTLEATKVKDLQEQLAQERTERIKVEREYMSLQQKAFAAPGSALGEVRSLREDLLQLRRDKALSEQKEAELRMDLTLLKTKMEGVSMEEFRRLQQQVQELQRALTNANLELQASNDKLDVYRRTQQQSSAAAHAAHMRTADAAATAGAATGGGGGMYLVNAVNVHLPDADKSDDEVRLELRQLREVYALEQAEMNKLRKLLDTESRLSLEAKAALEEAHRKLDATRAELSSEQARLRRELDNKDEKIRKLELQLRGAYAGVNRAVRTSTLRESVITEEPDDVSQLGDAENILELYVTEATLNESIIGKDTATFFTFDFYMHDTQATPEQLGPSPVFNTVIQYVIEPDTFFLEYLDTSTLELELCRARGWDFDKIGLARVPLRQVLEDLQLGAAVGRNKAQHHADIFGAGGQLIGRVRYAFNLKRPMDAMLREFSKRPRAAAISESWDMSDPAVAAVAKAQSNPAAASCIQVIVQRCERLRCADAAAARPYVSYRFPGQRGNHDTQLASGPDASLDDIAEFAICRTPELERDLRTREMEFVVFDDAAGDTAASSIVGIATVPLSNLATGVPLEGAFPLRHPNTGREAGLLWLGLKWHNPLTLTSEGEAMAHGQRVYGTAAPSAPSPAQAHSGAVATAAAAAAAAVPAGELLAEAPSTPATRAGAGARVNPLAAAAATAARDSMLPMPSPPPIKTSSRRGLAQEAAAPPPPRPQAAVAASSADQLLVTTSVLVPAPGAALPVITPPAAAASVAQQAVSAAAPAAPKPAAARQVSRRLMEPSPGAATGATAAQPATSAALSVAASTSSAPAAATTRTAASTGPTPVSSRDEPAGRSQHADDAAPTGSSAPDTSAAASVPSDRKPPVSQVPAASSNVVPVQRSGGKEESQIARVEAEPATSPATTDQTQATGSTDKRATSAVQAGLDVKHSTTQQVNVPLLQLLPPEHILSTTTPAPADSIYLALESLQLTPDALADPHLAHLRLCHLFLDEFCDPAEQCTAPLVKRQGRMALRYGVGYHINGAGREAAAARRELCQQLEEGSCKIHIILVSSENQNDSLDQVNSIGMCELDLGDIWHGRCDDLHQLEATLIPEPELESSYPSGIVGSVTVTLLAAKAMQQLRSA